MDWDDDDWLDVADSVGGSHNGLTLKEGIVLVVVVLALIGALVLIAGAGS